jgi:hypothetical protein
MAGHSPGSSNVASISGLFVMKAHDALRIQMKAL